MINFDSSLLSAATKQSLKSLCLNFIARNIHSYSQRQLPKEVEEDLQAILSQQDNDHNSSDNNNNNNNNNHNNQNRQKNSEEYRNGKGNENDNGNEDEDWG